MFQIESVLLQSKKNAQLLVAGIPSMSCKSAGQLLHFAPSLTQTKMGIPDLTGVVKVRPD